MDINGASNRVLTGPSLVLTHSLGKSYTDREI